MGCVPVKKINKTLSTFCEPIDTGKEILANQSSATKISSSQTDYIQKKIKKIIYKNRPVMKVIHEASPDLEQTHRDI